MNLLLVVLFAFTVRAGAYDSACGTGAQNSHAMAPPVWSATRAFRIAHIRHACPTSALQAASVLERMTFEEGGAWLPQRP
jgi:hypothetical protein